MKFISEIIISEWVTRWLIEELKVLNGEFLLSHKNYFPSDFSVHLISLHKTKKRLELPQRQRSSAFFPFLSFNCQIDTREILLSATAFRSDKNSFKNALTLNGFPNSIKAESLHETVVKHLINFSASDLFETLRGHCVWHWEKLF